MLIGTIRRSCLDFLVPINERHLGEIAGEFVIHYCRFRTRFGQDQESRSHHKPRFRPAQRGTGLPPGAASDDGSGGCITNTGWSKRLCGGYAVSADDTSKTERMLRTIASRVVKRVSS